MNVLIKPVFFLELFLEFWPMDLLCNNYTERERRANVLRARKVNVVNCGIGEIISRQFNTLKLN